MSKREVYGVDLSDAHFVPNAGELFFNGLATRGQKSALLQFVREHQKEYPSVEDAIPDFVDAYENETFLWRGLEGLIVDAINECIGDVGRYRSEYGCIYVEPYIRGTDNDLPPSRETIDRTLAYYLDYLLEEPVTVDWMYIYD